MSARAKLILNQGDPLQDLLAVVTFETGIEFGPKQMSMVLSRLARRTREAGFTNLNDYLNYFSGHKAAETPFVVSLLTTHHTYFFREYSQFEYLEREGLDILIKNLRASGRSHLRIWSAACSHGQEAYSLAMFMFYHLKRRAPEIKIEIFGSDICTESVNRARNGVYKWDELKRAPAIYTDSHWARGTGDIASYARASKALIDACKFEVRNLNEIERTLKGQKFDLIFCRNVFIYFDQSKVESIAFKMLDMLNPGGMLAVGLTESLTGTKLPIAGVGPSVFQAKAFAEVANAPSIKPKKNIRVICVDDSPTVLNILKKVLEAEYGFEVAGTATSAEEAVRLAKQVEYDVMTLDIHMPGKNGVDYLQENMRSDHPPVVMVSSVSQDNRDLALKAIDLGASDYVEKPELSNLHRTGEEIRAKIRAALTARSDSQTTRAFAATPATSNMENKIRIIITGREDEESLESIFRASIGPQPKKVVFDRNDPYLRENLAQIKLQYEAKNCSILILGDPPSILNFLTDWPGAQVVIEDLGQTYPDLPFTVAPRVSFAYESDRFLKRGDDS